MSVFKKLFGRGEPVEPPEFTTLLEQSMENLRFLTAHNQSWGIDKAETWNLDQAVGDLVFTFRDGSVKTPAQIIGGFDTTTSMWHWAWANPSVAEPLKRDVFRILEYGKQYGIVRLTTPEWEAEEMDGWSMAALATTLFKRNGAYRLPAGTFQFFITFGPVLGSLLDGKLKLDFGEPQISALDFSDVTSEKAALQLGLEGQLFKMLLFPKDFSGEDIPQNVVYVPCRALDIQDEIVSMIIPVVQQGLGVDFKCRAEYKGNSIVPAKIHYMASHSETKWKLDRTIEIW
jgi:uncharacterized protein DUF6882